MCQCTPGPTGTTPYPLPTQPQPAGWPTPPAFSCDNVNVCATLEQMQAQLAALQQALAANTALVTFLQRYRLPFAYIAGATHSNLTGTGAFATSRLIGVSVQVVAENQFHRISEGNPPYIWDLGWLSISDNRGVLQEKRISQANLVWLPEYMSDATRLSYELRPDVVADITELEAEP